MHLHYIGPLTFYDAMIFFARSEKPMSDERGGGGGGGGTPDLIECFQFVLNHANV